MQTQDLLRPISEFDPLEPALLHDRLKDRIIPWTGEESGFVPPLRAIPAGRNGSWDGFMLDGWDEPLGGCRAIRVAAEGTARRKWTTNGADLPANEPARAPPCYGRRIFKSAAPSNPELQRSRIAACCLAKLSNITFRLDGAERTAGKLVVLREVPRAEIALHDAPLFLGRIGRKSPAAD